MPSDEFFMKKALRFASKGKGLVEPNPLVGCIITKNNKTISQSFHQSFGKPHAEILALKKSGKKSKGATLYVNLEPCSHFGKTPPCTNAIVKARITRVVIATTDPNPKAKGGTTTLRKAGIKVKTGVLKKQAEKLNKSFFERVKQKKPFLILKAATSSNGFMTSNNPEDPRWISNKKSRKKAHELRAQCNAILVGVGTILADNPKLSCRIQEKHKQPLRVILDSTLQSPLNAKVFADNNVLVATTKKADKKKKKLLEKKGVKVVVLPSSTKREVSLKKLLGCLFELGIESVLVEGGPAVHKGFLEKKLADRLVVFKAKKKIKRGKKFPLNLKKIKWDKKTKLDSDTMLEKNIS
ncbi:MAG: bifunctional diaminohydroxyphosphoribosylaminopyrimidine deaminase/5-amino-6-(5-phosphoribosylamino)uracil reductase RibD [Candidatus Micrarchaeia archaeon]